MRSSFCPGFSFYKATNTCSPAAKKFPLVMLLQWIHQTHESEYSEQGTTHDIEHSRVINDVMNK